MTAQPHSSRCLDRQPPPGVSIIGHTRSRLDSLISKPAKSCCNCELARGAVSQQAGGRGPCTTTLLPMAHLRRSVAEGELGSSWGGVREKTLTRPRTSEQRNRSSIRRPQSPASARPSTSHVNGRRPVANSGNSGSVVKSQSKFAQAAQKAVSIVNGGCLCKHPTLSKGGGECEHCKRRLPVIASHQNFPMRSRSGSVQFGEAPPLPKANKPPNMGIATG